MLNEVKKLAQYAGLRNSDVRDWLREELALGASQGLVVFGKSVKRESGHYYEYLVFSEIELVAVGSEQGNYAGSLDWRIGSSNPFPNLPEELRVLVTKYRALPKV